MQREANKEQSSQAFRTQDAGQPLEHVEPHQYMPSQCHWSLWPPGSRVMGYGQLGHKRVPQAENKPKSVQGFLRCCRASSSGVWRGSVIVPVLRRCSDIDQVLTRCTIPSFWQLAPQSATRIRICPAPGQKYICHRPLLTFWHLRRHVFFQSSTVFSFLTEILPNFQ
jgi:hypothetical protein